MGTTMTRPITRGVAVSRCASGNPMIRRSWRSSWTRGSQAIMSSLGTLAAVTDDVVVTAVGSTGAYTLTLDVL
jgi:hypothetical protein